MYMCVYRGLTRSVILRSESAAEMPEAEDITAPKRFQETALSLKLNIDLCLANDFRYFARYRCIYFICFRQRVNLTRPVVNKKSCSLKLNMGCALPTDPRYL